MFGNRRSTIPAGANLIEEYRADAVASNVEGDFEIGLGVISALAECVYARHSGIRLDLPTTGFVSIAGVATVVGLNNRFRTSRFYNSAADEGEAALRAKGLDPKAVAMPKTNS